MSLKNLFKFHSIQNKNEDYLAIFYKVLEITINCYYYKKR